MKNPHGKGLKEAHLVKEAHLKFYYRQLYTFSGVDKSHVVFWVFLKLCRYIEVTLKYFCVDVRAWLYSHTQFFSGSPLAKILGRLDKSMQLL